MWGQGNPGVLEELIRKWEDYFTGQERPVLKGFYQNVKE